MVFVPRWDKYKRTPTALVELADNNPITDGISAAVVGSQLVRPNITPTLTSVSLSEFAPDGFGYAQTATLSNVKIAPANTLLNSGTGGNTFIVVSKKSDTTARNSLLFGVNTLTSPNRIICHAPYSDGKIYFDIASLTGSAGRLSVSNPTTPAVDSTRVYTFVANGGRGREIWLNGKKIAGNASDNTSLTPNTDLLGFGANANVNADVCVTPLFVTAKRAFSVDEIAAIAENPYQLFKPRRKYWLLSAVDGSATGATITATASLTAGTATGTATIARPNADTASGDWTPSTGATLYGCLDEMTYDDADYISTTTTTAATLALSTVTDPLSSTGHVIRFRAKSPNANTLTVTLKQGGTAIKTETTAALTGSYADYSITLSGAEADSITDYSALTITLEAAA